MRTVFIFIISLFFFAQVCHAEIDTGAWKITKSEHFVVYSRTASVEYVAEVLRKAEAYYYSITEDLGFTRFDKFWTWENRATIYLFSDADEYKKITDNPGWSGGGTNVYERKIYTFVNMKNFFDVILPHEIGHIVFREFVGYAKPLPLWLDEGVACYLEKSQRAGRLKTARALVRSKLFMQINELEGVNKMYLLIMPDIFYAESASIIEFLVRTYGMERFIEFMRKLRDLRNDQSWEMAVEGAYQFRNIDELNARWMNFLFEEKKGA